MKIRLAATLAACVILAACGGMGLPSPGQVSGGGIRGAVKVALVDVFSGTSGFIGADLKNSVQLEIDDLNSRGGLLGHQLQLVTADDELKLDRTPTVVRQVLADTSVRLLIGPSFAGLYLAAKSDIERVRVPNCLTSMAADDVMADAPFSFRAQARDDSRVPAMLAYLQKGTQLRKIGLITEDDSPGHRYEQQLSSQAGRYGLQYVGAAFVPGSGDQKAQVQQLLQRGAEAVFVSDNATTAQRTLLAIKQANATTRLRAFGFGGVSAYGFVQQAGDPANGLIFASTIQTYMSDVAEAKWPPAYRDFVKQVIARYGREANGVEMKGSPAAADCVTQWARAVQAANDFDGVHVAKAWETLDIPAAETVLGVHERFSATDHDAVPPEGLSVYQWARTGDRWILHQLA